MAFSVSPIVSKDGNANPIPGGVDFVDTSGTGVGPWIIAKSTIDPAGVNVQFVLANNAAKCDVSSINGTTTPTGHGTAATCMRVELPSDGTGLVNAAQSGTWTVQQGGAPWSVTANAGTNLNTSALALDTSVNGLLVAQGSTTSGEKGPLIQGAVTTSSPSYTTGQTAPLSIDPSGNLRVNLNANGFGTVTVAGTVTANAGTNLNTSALALESGGNLATVAGAIISQGTALGTIKELMVAGSVTTNAPAYTTGQISPVSLTTGGGVRIDLKDTVANTNNINVNLAASGATVTISGTVTANQGGTWTVQQGTPPWTVNPGTPGNWGIGATGSAVPANAVYKAGLAKTALPTAGTDGNLTGAMMDKFGRQVVLAATIRDLTGTQTTTISASTTETTIVTAAASVFNDLVMLIVSNTSTATNTRIDFRDTTAGTILFSLQSNGGQPPVGFALPVPIPQTTVNTNWTAQCATSTTDIRIYAVFAKNK